ncbi:MAG: DUF2905 domain-containing protein [Candidatus Stahlbacteria bacterium]|nr:DUF2905 domain-containing protein [Candidatus Stahlbacteria bacterium]
MWNISKWLIIIGSILIILGAVGLVLQKTGLGKVMYHLPGDIRIQRGNFSFFFPITSCILISMILTLICSIVMRVLRH